MILIFTQEPTNRISYIVNLIFSDLLGIEHEITSDPGRFISHGGTKFSYGNKPIADEIFIKAAHLLFEKDIKKQELGFADGYGSRILFPVFDRASALPFDPFAASFFLVSRYEEYLPFQKDQHGRFSPVQSIAYAQGFLDKPLVNQWALLIAGILKQRFPSMIIPERKFRFIPTIDIDSAYAYSHKGFYRNAGGYIRSLFQADFIGIRERTGVLAGYKSDPFDTYDFQLSLQKIYSLNPVYFILLGDHSANDKNLPSTNPHFRKLVQRLAANAEVGIHPSYASYGYPARVQLELSRLSAILDRPVGWSRQHFLRLSFPATYRELIKLGITGDFTMGYAQEPGFRASICEPFLFYDLLKDEPSSLRIYPFTVMDGTLKDYKHLSTEEAHNTICHLIDEIKAVNGTFITVWHNESLSDEHRWEGWRALYEQMICYALSIGRPAC